MIQGKYQWDHYGKLRTFTVIKDEKSYYIKFHDGGIEYFETEEELSFYLKEILKASKK